ncbi:MAG: PAS domain S-box protein [Candidatus Omnitrophica bacterium]|nr:PAS domain S-box protein [Candidatus Omnitrophota bacterium]
MDDKDRKLEDILTELNMLRDTIAEMRSQEQARLLGQSKEVNYTAIFNAANDAFFVHDIETSQILDVNKKACEMYCYPKEEMLRLDVGAISAGEKPYSQEDAIGHIRKAAEGEPQLFEWVSKDKAGRLFWVEVNLKRAVIGGKYRLLAIVRDIDERKQTEDRLRMINEAFLNFTVEPLENINSLTALLGKLLGADCALYNRLEGDTLSSCGMWNVPEGFTPIDKAKGHICYDVIMKDSPGIVVVRNLPETEYAKTDPNVTKYNLKTYIGCPVSFGGSYVGSLCAVYQYDFVPNEEDKKIMGIIASAIGNEEERKNAVDSILKRDYQLEILSRTSQHVNAILEEPAITRTLVAAAMELVDAAGGTAGLIDGGKMVFSEYNTGTVLRSVNYVFEPDHGVYNWLANSKKPYISNNAENDPKILPEKKKDFNLYNLVNVPILGSGGRLIGCFEIHNKKDKLPFDAQDVFMLQGLAAGAAIALENARAIAEEKKVEQALSESEERYRRIIENTNDVIMLTKPDGIISYLSPACKSVLGYDSEDLMGREPWIVHKDDAKKAKKAFSEFLKGGSGANFEYRIMTKDGQTRWVSHSWSPIKTGEKLNLIVSVVRDITERKAAEKEKELLNKELLKSNKRLKQLAMKDIQTGLYNHYYLAEIIDVEFYRARRYGHPLSLIMLDIDYFKSINDVYGVKFGDLVLKQFAAYLKKMVRRYDTVIRFGGEEFVVLSPGVDKQKSLMVAQRLLDAINLYNFGDKKRVIKLKVSIAVSSYPDGTIFKGMDLINFAEKLLDKVKHGGGNKVFSSFDLKNDKERIAEEAIGSMDVRALKEKIEKLTRRGNQNLIESIFAFAKTLEMKDHYTGEHVESTVHYSTEVAKSLHLSAEEIDNIRQASALHDLGKVGISDKILHKKSKLTKKEFSEIKKHPQIAADIIRPIQFMHDIIPLVLYHHERWDGKGYPAGLHGEEIPVGARIIAVADVYQALISNRPYRKAYPKIKAFKIIRDGSGTQFDPIVVKAFLKILKKEKRAR